MIKQRHIIFIDELSKLEIKKDSTLMLAAEMKKQDLEVYLLFEKDFFFVNFKTPCYLVYDFDFKFLNDSFYLDLFDLTKSKTIELKKGDVFHMRLDPPFDTRYMRYLWMQKALKAKEIEIINDPNGILLHNEKLYAYEQKASLPSFIGSSKGPFLDFLNLMREKGHDDLILKPLDLYQGIGVEKLTIKGRDNKYLEDFFLKLVKTYSGPVVVQPFAKEVMAGEIRSLFYKGKELGSILKVPAKGEFLANIARGASYQAIELSENQKINCQKICKELAEFNVPWIAFDILGDNISEVNITCPGLLVEVSMALKRNLASEIIDLL